MSTYGIGASLRVLDQSLVLITTQYAAQAPFTLWGFLAPFTNNLWAGVLGVIVVSAIAHILLDKIEQHFLGRNAKYGPPVSIEVTQHSYTTLQMYLPLHHLLRPIIDTGSNHCTAALQDLLALVLQLLRCHQQYGYYGWDMHFF